jgi:hypothetical protein
LREGRGVDVRGWLIIDAGQSGTLGAHGTPSVRDRSLCAKGRDRGGDGGETTLGGRGAAGVPDPRFLPPRRLSLAGVGIEGLEYARTSNRTG